uniref:Uncharacterized protein n=1 Tax=Noctiluca scintillans TaxID=2966 RepID=A0A7S1AF34_NOCSC|eukprot:CAMPEP_0194479508 /NCGR_PEP_ID=MMETSP0253-20130528/2603_1 /TAXON_ID=2966 /ORGANISM="Noctiluca scintillans" /LENGTH=162 /DNA_ID=CAMNT_0039318743 /DNA_START=41 /DNA_END=529 /DNA_ORIENTATION=+
MGALMSLPVGTWLVPTEMLLKVVPPLFDPISALTHGAFLVYLPMLLRSRASPGGYDNVNPRGQIQKYAHDDSVFARLNAAHLNAMENWPFFAAAVLASLHCGVDRTRLSKLATFWVLARALYIPTYVYQNETTCWLRSFLFVMSYGVTMNMLREAAVKLKPV